MLNKYHCEWSYWEYYWKILLFSVCVAYQVSLSGHRYQNKVITDSNLLTL